MMMMFIVLACQEYNLHSTFPTIAMPSNERFCLHDDDLLFCNIARTRAEADLICEQMHATLADPTTVAEQVDIEQFDHIVEGADVMFNDWFWTAWPHNMDCPAMIMTARGIAGETSCERKLPFVCEIQNGEDDV